MVHYRGAVLDESNAPMMHALSGAARGSAKSLTNNPHIFVAKHPHSEFVESAKIIQKAQREKVKKTLYSVARQELTENKLMYQRVRHDDATPDTQRWYDVEVKARAIQRMKEAYALSADEQLAAFEDMMKAAQDVRDEAQVNAYQRAKAAKAAAKQHPHYRVKPSVARSRLQNAAMSIQRMTRSWLRRRAHAFLLETAVATLVDSKQFYQRAEQPEPGTPTLGSPRPRHVLANVKLDAQDRAALVTAAMQRAAEEAEVNAYQRWKAVRAAVQTGPKIVPRHARSLLAAKASLIQSEARHFLARRKFAAAEARWRTAGEKDGESLFAPRGSPVHRSPRRPQTPAGEVAAGEVAAGEVASATSAEAELAARLTLEDSWMDTNSLLLEDALSSVVQAAAESRPAQPLAFMADCLVAMASGTTPMAPRQAIRGSEDEWMALNGPALEGAISSLLQAVAQARPDDPIRFMADHLRSRS